MRDEKVKLLILLDMSIPIGGFRWVVIMTGPLGRWDLGILLIPQYSIDSLMPLRLPGRHHITSRAKLINSKFISLRKKGRGVGGATLGLNYTNQFLDKMCRLPERGTRD